MDTEQSVAPEITEEQLEDEMKEEELELLDDVIDEEMDAVSLLNIEL